MGAINGVAIGIVKGFEDPDNLGRIQLKLPWLTSEDKNKLYLARIATLMAGPGRGSWFMPELEDEVLVAFDHGDIQHPYIVGFLWNGKDKPPNKDINKDVRRIETVSRHKVDFDDRGGQEKIHIQTQNGHQVDLQDSPNSQITITTSGGHKIELKDGLTGQISITTSGRHNIKLIDSPLGQITITTSKGQSIELQDAPKPEINVNSLLTNFSGLVKVKALGAASFPGQPQLPAFPKVGFTPAGDIVLQPAPTKVLQVIGNVEVIGDIKASGVNHPNPTALTPKPLPDI